MGCLSFALADPKILHSSTHRCDNVYGFFDRYHQNGGECRVVSVDLTVDVVV